MPSENSDDKVLAWVIGGIIWAILAPVLPLACPSESRIYAEVMVYAITVILSFADLKSAISMSIMEVLMCAILLKIFYEADSSLVFSSVVILIIAILCRVCKYLLEHRN